MIFEVCQKNIDNYSYLDILWLCFYNREGHPSFTGLHFLDAGSYLVPMLQRGNLHMYAFPRWSMGTRSAILY